MKIDLAKPASTLINMKDKTLTTEQIRKEEEKKEAAAESMKVRCKVCFKEIAPVRRCSGHGAPEGGGSDDAMAVDEEFDDADQMDLDEELDYDPIVLQPEPPRLTPENELEVKLIDQILKLSIIAELIVQDLFEIINDRESMTLTFSLKCTPQSLTKEQRKELKEFLENVIKAFKEFKQEQKLAHDGLRVVHDREGNIISLSVNLPNLGLYDSFIQRLNNPLITEPRPQAASEEKAQEYSSPTPNPFSMQLKPV